MVSGVSPSTVAAEFETIVLVHRDALYNMALRVTRNPSEAQDLVQETLLKAYRFLHRFEPGTNIRAWLFTILRNTYINMFRKNVRSVEWSQVDIDKVAPYIADPISLDSKIEWSSAENIRQYGMHDETARSLDDLPEDYRDVLLLVDLKEHSYKETAALVGCPVGTVMSRLHRARGILRKNLEVFARESGHLRN